MTDRTLFSGAPVGSVRVFAQNVDIWLEPVDSEVRRRRESAEGSLGDHLIRGLMTLPVGIPVPLTAVKAEMLLVLDEALEAGAVRAEREAVVRFAVPPVDLTGMVKPVETWEDAQALTLLRTHAPRLAVASPHVAQRMLREVDQDVGIAIRDEFEVHVLRNPGRRWVRPSWQRWVIAETAFRAWHASGISSEQ